MRMMFTSEELYQRFDTVLSSPTDEGILEMIVQRPAVDHRNELHEGRLVPGIGLEGDRWGDRAHQRKRNLDTQLTIMNSRAAELVAGSRDRWSLAGDQLYVDLDLSERNLPPGSVLHLGDATIEITSVPHNGCKKFSARYGADALAFFNSRQGKELHLRGLYGVVTREGIISVGDTVRVISR